MSEYVGFNSYLALGPSSPLWHLNGQGTSQAVVCLECVVSTDKIHEGMISLTEISTHQHFKLWKSAFCFTVPGEDRSLGGLRDPYSEPAGGTV